MSTRQLTEQEITLLESRDCRAEDWSRVTVAEHFAVGASFHRVSFSGNVELGGYAGDVTVTPGLRLPAGVVHSRLHNVRIGDNCYVNDATLSDTDVGDDVVIDNVSAIVHDGTGAFGNDGRAGVLAEDGARSVPIWRGMSSQLAHILCHLKGHPAAAALEAMIARDVRDLAVERCHIGDGCRLQRVGLLKSVRIGPGAVLEGVARLAHCHVEGGVAPARIGEGVSAKRCVFQAACRVVGGTRLEDCLVGEGVILDRAFYGEHCLFFANSDFRLGEALSAMAGPFSVSHHKATLVLACQCSFCNFGSASNSSNHHFKLGPRHGGVMRRGTRCGSGSYIFWPADIGAFTTVVGRHASDHLDTAIFPFSLLVPKGETSVLVPGVNLFGIGCYRDEIKWGERDRRGGVPRPLDMVNTAVFSPYVMQSMEEGASLLRRSQGMGADLRHGGATIPARRIAPALRLYEASLVYYIGLCLLRRAETEARGGAVCAADVAGVIAGATRGGRGYSGGRWRDWGGMLLSGADAAEFLGDVENGRLDTPEKIRVRLEELHALYADRELEWAAWQWRLECGEPTADGAAEFFRGWRKAVEFRCECMAKDVGKEFTPEVMYGFGVEAGAAESFRRARGDAEREPYLVRAVEERDGLLKAAGNIR